MAGYQKLATFLKQRPSNEPPSVPPEGEKSLSENDFDSDSPEVEEDTTQQHYRNLLGFLRAPPNDETVTGHDLPHTQG